MSYQITNTQITKEHQLHEYCSQFTHGANSFSNAVLFRQRQVFTAMQKDESRWTDNERGVMDEIRDALPLMGNKYGMPTAKNRYLSDGFLKKLMVVTKNPDYYNPYISNQSCQQIVAQRGRDMKSFRKASADYRQHPDKYKAKPNLPKYKKSGGMSSVTLTNQDCYLEQDDAGLCWLKLPLTKIRLAVGYHITGRLKEVRIIPNHEIFTVTIVLEVPEPKTVPAKVHRRIANIDPGVDNLASITNNIGEPCLVFKGGTIKSANQWYNKQMAKIQSEQTKGGTKEFVMTPEAHELCVRRDNQINDFLHKVSKQIVNWCVENHIDTLIYGCNIWWKQESDMGHKENQTFVQIPLDRFRQMLQYLCIREGIAFINREESYTSKASFLDLDYIPTYGVDDENSVFSGRRRPTHYKGMYKKNGFRGLYTSKDGTIINADLNGSANIGRKAVPDMYDSGVYPDFGNVIIIRHPDIESRAALNSRQKAKNTGMSRSKQKRLRRKGKLPLAAQH